jgi:hypothetical protein
MLSEKPEENTVYTKGHATKGEKPVGTAKRETKGMQKGYMVPNSFSQNVFYLFVVYLAGHGSRAF